VQSRFSGRRCVDEGASCRKHSDCEPCEECVAAPGLESVATCRPAGSKCEKDSDCKEKNYRCLESSRGHGSDERDLDPHLTLFFTGRGKRCRRSPPDCRDDDDCDSGRQCVLSAVDRGRRRCEPRPERCSDHEQCQKGQECVETLIRGFNGPEWSGRCLAVPFRRCDKG